MSELGEYRALLERAHDTIKRLEQRLELAERGHREAIAIVGMGCRYPGGVADAAGYWDLLSCGRDGIVRVPADRWDAEACYDPDPAAPGKTNSRFGGFIDDVALFDAMLFNMSPREAASTDPQHRLMLMMAWEALEDAGYSPHSLRGARAGVFVGINSNDYALLRAGAPETIDAYCGTANIASAAAGRVSYTFGLEGPSLSVDTACSSSLVSLHLACRSLRAGECDLALAGGVNLMLAPNASIYMAKTRTLAPDGRCKTFDDHADGIGRGEGCGVLVLKRLSDAERSGDRIVAVVRGSAVNQDGRSSGFTVPNVQAQIDVISAALLDSGVSCLEIDYVEAHGTGTRLGDPIEVEALGRVYGVGREAGDGLLIGSVKTNLGHLEAAAGVAGVMKVALGLCHGELPGHLHVKELSRRIDWDGLGVEVVRSHRVWPRRGAVRRAGVSSFGMSGTNAHVVLESWAGGVEGEALADERAHLLAVSAGSEGSVRGLLGRYASALGAGGGLSEAVLSRVSFAAGAGRAHLSWRAAVVGDDGGRAGLLAGLAAARDGAASEVAVGRSLQRPSGEVVFLFPGQGAQKLGMGLELLSEGRGFAESFMRSEAAWREVEGSGPGLAQLLEGALGAAALERTEWTQPLLYAVEMGLVAQWREWGVTPVAVLGHSVGEYAAAVTAGVMSLEDGLRLVAARGRVMGNADVGAMASVFAGEARVQRLLGDGVWLAAVNGPEEVVLSGETLAVERALRALTAEGISCRRLAVSHGFHSGLMDQAGEQFEAVASRQAYEPARLGWVGNLEGGWRERVDGALWARSITAPVRFWSGAQLLWQAGYRRFVEIGPGSGLVSALRRGLAADAAEGMFTGSLDGGEERRSLLKAAGRLYVSGVDLCWSGVSGQQGRPRCEGLPLYAFERQRHWLAAERGRARGAAAGEEVTAEVRSLLEGGVYRTEWRAQEVGGSVAAGGAWRVIGGLPELAAAVKHALEQRGCRIVESEADGAIEGVIDLEAAAMEETPRGAERLVAELALKWRSGAGRLWVVTEGAAPAVDGRGALQSVVWGLCRSAALEHPERWGGLIDIDGAEDVRRQGERVAASVLGRAGEDQQSWRGGVRRVARLVRQVGLAGTEARPRAGVWLITGGLGALGLWLAEGLADRGVTELVLVGRSVANAAVGLRVRGLVDRGVKVDVRSLDVGDGAAVASLVAEFADRLGGIVHAAGESVMGRIEEASDAAGIARGLRGKVGGGWHLDQATRGLGVPLISLGSVSAVWGSAGQSVYAAANRFLEGLSESRRAAGEPALTLSWGPWREAGMTSPEGLDRLDRLGVSGVSPRAGVAVFCRLALGAWRDGPGCAAVAAVAWEKFAPVYEARGRQSLIADLVVPTGGAETGAELREGNEARRTEVVARLKGVAAAERTAAWEAEVRKGVAEVLGHADGQRVERERGFFDLGLDSLLAVELTARLSRRLGLPLEATVVFDHPNVAALAAHLRRRLEGGAEPAAAARAGWSEEAIAIVGVGCRFPGGVVDGESYWRLLSEGRDAVTAQGAQRWPDEPKARWGGFLSEEELTGFDAGFFGIAPREAERMDPQQRLLLQVGWEALEDAGIAADRLRGTAGGVFVGITSNEYGPLVRAGAGVDGLDLHYATGNVLNAAAGRLSYVLGLRGPSLAVDTACSSSLVAVHLACRSLHSRECEVALAGGVNALLTAEGTLAASAAQMLSPDGRCKTFDAQADGYVRGEGCGVVVLKRLSAAQASGDRVLGVIVGSAMNHNGGSGGLTVPSGTMQAALLSEALGRAGVEGSAVDYVEAHGTGTSLGDPIEVEALGRVYGRERASALVIGSVKTNIGHLESAAGIAGLIKVVLQLQHGEFVPHLHYRTPNPRIGWERLALRVGTARQRWPRSERPRLAGVSSFGFSGTNAHVVVAEAPASSAALPPAPSAALESEAEVLVLSARDAGALSRLAQRYGERLSEAGTRLREVAHTVAVGRSQFDHRVAVVARDATTASRRLLNWAAGREAEGVAAAEAGAVRVGLVFSGQGGAYAGMGAGVGGAFAAGVAAVSAALSELGAQGGLYEVYRRRRLEQAMQDEAALGQTVWAQPALLALQWGLVEQWRWWGVRPMAVLGHSVGEYAAAACVGALQIGEAVRLVAARAVLMEEVCGNGLMVRVAGAEAKIAPRLPAEVTIAAVNGAEEVVISGAAPAVRLAAQALAAAGYRSEPMLQRSGFHSPLMAPLQERFAAALHGLAARVAPQPYVSGLRGRRLHQGEPLDAGYWWDNLRQPVRWHDALQAMIGEAEPPTHLIEIGPGAGLLALARRSLGNAERPILLPSLARNKHPNATLDTARANLAAHHLETANSNPNPIIPKINLPKYPFDARHYWMGPQLGRRAAPKTENSVYSIAWRSANDAASHLASVQQIVDSGLSLVAEARRKLAASRYPSLVDAMERASVAYAVAGLRQIGLETLSGEMLSTQTIARRLGVVADHHRLLDRLLTMAATQGGVARCPAGWTIKAGIAEAREDIESLTTVLQESDHGTSEARLLIRCATALPDVITGRRNALDVLFAGDAGRDLAKAYEDAPVAAATNTLVAAAVAAAVRDIPNHDRVRVLEIGGGTGATTAAVLSALPADRTEFTFTDVSSAFLPDARRRFSGGIRFEAAVLDIERDPGSQGFKAGDFDIVVASNVLHATQHLDATVDHARRLLVAGGILLLVEATRRDYRLDLVFGLTSGWWAFRDHERRPDHALLSAGQWRSLLANRGLKDVATLGGPDQDTLPGQCVFLARQPATPEPSSVGAIVVSDQPDHPVILELAARLATEGVVRGNPVAASGLPPGLSRILFVPAADAIGDDAPAEAIEAAQRRPIETLLALARYAAESPSPPQLLMLTRGALLPNHAAQTAGGLQHAPLVGITRVIRRELPDIRQGLIDLDPLSAGLAHDVDAIANALRLVDAESEIAVRGGALHLPRLVPAPIVLSAKPLKLRHDRAYVILGGLGSLGLAVARQFAEQGAGIVALIGRSAPTPALHPMLQAIRAAGAEVVIEAADISNFAELSAAIARIEDRAVVAGIVHAAGTLDDGLVLHQNWPRFATVFAAKVKGAWNLARLLRTRKPEFVVFFSTAAAIIGNAGQANHAAANMFVDALAHVLRAMGIPAQTINWGAWRDIGAARRRSDQHMHTSAFDSIAPAEGLALLDCLIREGAAQRVIFPADWRAYFARQPGGMPRGMLEELRPIDAEKRGGEPTPVANLLSARLANADPAEWPRLVEERVQACVAQVLGLAAADRVPLHTTLGDLGLDSLMALQLRDVLARTIDRPLPATLAFDHPTAARLSAHLQGVLRPAAPADQMKSVRNILTDLDAIEQMSDSEAAGLLSGLADTVDGVHE